MKTESLEVVLAALDNGLTPADHVVADAAKELTVILIRNQKIERINRFREAVLDLETALSTCALTGKALAAFSKLKKL